MLKYDTPFQARLHEPWERARSRTMAALNKFAFDRHYLDSTTDSVRAGKLYHKIGDCGHDICMYQAEEDGRILVCTARCKSRMCPRCSAIRAAQARECIKDAARDLNSPRFITLTPLHSDEPLRDQIKHLRESYTRLRRSKGWKLHVVGAIAVMEVKWSKRDGRWHPHMHVIADGSFWSQPMLSRAWSKASGGATIVDIRMIHNRGDVARYVSKYVTDTAKNDKMPFERIAEYATAMHGCRLLSTCGTMHGRVRESRPKTGRGPLEMVPGLRALASDAANGDLRARRIVRAVGLAQRLPNQDGGERLNPADQHRSRKVAGRVRAWWESRTGVHSDETAPKPASKRTKPRVGDGPEWLWQEQHVIADALLHGR